MYYGAHDIVWKRMCCVKDLIAWCKNIDELKPPAISVAINIAHIYRINN